MSARTVVPWLQIEVRGLVKVPRWQKAKLNISGVDARSEQRYGGSGGGKERCSGFLSWVMTRCDVIPL